VDLDVDDERVDAAEGARADAGEHGLPRAAGARLEQSLGAEYRETAREECAERETFPRGGPRVDCIRGPQLPAQPVPGRLPGRAGSEGHHFAGRPASSGLSRTFTSARQTFAHGKASTGCGPRLRGVWAAGRQVNAEGCASPRSTADVDLPAEQSDQPFDDVE